jgi:eukaryotic-like serine/threonine-protein kinase
MTIDTGSIPEALWPRVLEVYGCLIGADAETRAAALAEIEKEEPMLAAHVVRLFEDARDMQARGFLTGEARRILVTSGAGNLSHRTDAAFGNYKLERLLGSGGMGEVWVAQRADGRYKGRVAVKILHPGLAHSAVRERFTREGEILARLSHPNIAHLLDAGATEAGQLYLVLEFVRGERIDQWCDSRNLAVSARLQLFLQVCDAIAHAHLHLVVHRDLKPSNILVTEDGAIKLLDFGIAKLVEPSGEAADTTELTRHGGSALTPQYAAPEQVLGASITTVTDVYALGVLLYRLLTGRMPYGASAMTTTQWEREVLEAEPPLPSQAALLTVLPDDKPWERAAARSSTPEKLWRELRGDLDNIISKALRKAPGERYRSVLALADDIRRHLAHEPVLARPESLVYRAAKFVRRNRAAVAATALVLLIAAAGLAGIVWQNREAREAARVAELQRQRAENVKEFLVSVFGELDPFTRPAPEQRSPQELLGRATHRLESELSSDPQLRAQLLGDLGEIQFNLGEVAQGQALLREGLAAQRAQFGAQSMEVARGLYRLAVAEYTDDRRAQAEQHLREGLDILIRRKALHSVEAAKIQAQLAFVLSAQVGARPEVLEMIQQARATAVSVLQADDPELANILVRHGQILWRARNVAAAEAVLRDAVSRYERALGRRATQIWYPLNSLAQIVASAGRFDEAEQMLDRALTLLRANVGPRHRHVAGLMLQKADVLQRTERFEEALRMYAMAEEALPPGADDERRTLLRDRAMLYFQMGRAAQAEREMHRAYDFARQTLGEDVPQVSFTASDWGRTLAAVHRYGEAEKVQRAALARVSAGMGPDAYQNCLVLDGLGMTLLQAGRNREAAEMQRRSLRLTERRYPRTHKVWAERAWLLVGSLILVDDAAARAEALQLLNQSVQVLTSLDSKDMRLPEMHKVHASLAAEVRTKALR